MVSLLQFKAREIFGYWHRGEVETSGGLMETTKHCIAISPLRHFADCCNCNDNKF
jgi:hypothetical protein